MVLLKNRDTMKYGWVSPENWEPARINKCLDACFCCWRSFSFMHTIKTCFSLCSWSSLSWTKKKLFRWHSLASFINSETTQTPKLMRWTESVHLESIFFVKMKRRKPVSFDSPNPRAISTRNTIGMMERCLLWIWQVKCVFALFKVNVNHFNSF